MLLTSLSNTAYSIAASENLKTFYSKWYGINTRSLLIEAPYFDPCEQLVQDVMHVFLEGVLAY